MKTIKLLFISAVTVLLVACAAADSYRLAAHDEEEYGLGGTGIVGSVTGFGSIFVNGLELEITDQTVISLNGQRLSEYQFQIGETVEILAADSSSHSDALRVNIRQELIGPIAGYDKERQILQVLGQQVRLEDDGKEWLPGQFVAVSGYVDQNGLIQARLIQRQQNNRVLLRGEVDEIEQRLEQNGISIIGGDQLGAFKGTVLVEGTLKQRELDIQRIQMQPLLPFKQVGSWRIEGFASHYSARWSELKKLPSSATQPLQFELKIKANGKVAIKQLETKSLRRGAKQSLYAPFNNRSQSPMRRQSGSGAKGRP